MADKVRIFICYKKRDADNRESNSAYQLYQFLREEVDYDVWMDEGLDAGLLWEKTIYERLISSDVVILAIGNGTSESEWVRREVSVAMAFDIQVVPVGLSITELQLHHELMKLGLTGLHYKRPFNIASQTARAIVGELAPAIQRGRTATRQNGHALLKAINEHIRPKVVPGKPNLSAASAILTSGSRPISIHIASGDIFRLSNIELLVNSENDYMQMARIFDMASMSASIRHYGCSIERGYLEDTIQLEIERSFVGRPRPVPPATSIVTSSGGPTSSLYRTNRISHVVHVAAVQAVLAENRIVPLRSDSQIRDCVTSAFVAVQDLCSARGVISPEGTAQRQLQERSASSFMPTRVVLPLFGTGRGGQSPSAIAPIMLEAIQEFFSGPLLDAHNMPIKDVHLSVFSEEDVEAVSALISRLDQKSRGR